VKRIMFVLTVAVLLAVFGGGALAQTAPQGTLDANNLDTPSGGGVGIGSDFANGQTFTVEHTGMLTGARVHVAKSGTPGDLTVQIANVDTTSGLPTVPEDVIASTTIPASSLPDTGITGVFPTVDVVFDTPASVVAGKQYALILKATGVGTDIYIQEISALTRENDSYPEGMRIFQRNPFGSTPGQWDSGEADFGFTFDTIFGIYVTQPDTTPPEVSSTSPPNDATEVPPTANIRATFSEEMDSTTINDTTYKLFKKGTTTQIPAQVSYNADTDTAKLDPTKNLRRGVAYKAVVTTEAKDVEGNRLDQDGSTSGLQQMRWFFRVDD
jgi:hypothetical protein